jgi:hypothetical protein
MARLRTHCVLVVKYSHPTYYNGTAWVEYRSARGRSLEGLQRYFGRRPTFRFCIIHEYDRKSRKRLGRVGYFDRNRIEYAQA